MEQESRRTTHPRRFSAVALAHLRGAEYDPAATRYLDLCAGGYAWSDEGLRNARTTGEESDSLAERLLVAYRGTLVCGKPKLSISGPWEQLRKAVPGWPGFRPERISRALGRELTEDLEGEFRAFEEAEAAEAAEAAEERMAKAAAARSRRLTRFLGFLKRG